MKPARMVPGEWKRKHFTPDEIAEAEREFLQDVGGAQEAEPYLRTPLTQEEIRELHDNHRPCPWKGRRADNCNMMELIYSLAKKRKEQQEKLKSSPRQWVSSRKDGAKAFIAEFPYTQISAQMPGQAFTFTAEHI